MVNPQLATYVFAPANQDEWARLPAIRQLLLGELAGQWVDYHPAPVSRLAEQVIWGLTHFLRDRRQTPLTRFAGMLYDCLDSKRIEAKDFVSAERIFRKLGKDYRDTSSGILGDYGLGKALLIQNKTEEALETLTDIPKRYPKHPFLHTVYLGLGDFYSAQQQWDNAIAAFNQVTKDSTFDGNYRLAIRSLLDVYDRMGLKDRALALARHYVARFPEDARALDLRIKVGLLLIDLLQFDDAIAHLKRLKPFVDATIEPEVQYYIGKSHMNAGRFELAIAELLRVKFFSKPSKLPWDVIALYDAATCYTRINNCSMAKKLFLQIVREQGAASDFGRFANTKVSELGACTVAN
ncbi:tetratricopeptide repeat protein [candidate division KSB1 bacterium]|nr:tetratricopeptide repeat protein [candidate division KSB1 bacterium]